MKLKTGTMALLLTVVSLVPSTATGPICGVNEYSKCTSSGGEVALGKVELLQETGLLASRGKEFKREPGKRTKEGDPLHKQIEAALQLQMAPSSLGYGFYQLSFLI